MFSRELVEELKKSKEFSKDSDLLNILPKATKSVISEIKSGKRHLTEEQALFIANECGLNPGWVLVNLAAETAKVEEAKSVWSNLAKKLSKSVTAGLLALTVIFAGLDENRADSPVFS